MATVYTVQAAPVNAGPLDDITFVAADATGMSFVGASGKEIIIVRAVGVPLADVVLVAEDDGAGRGAGATNNVTLAPTDGEQSIAHVRQVRNWAADGVVSMTSSDATNLEVAVIRHA